MRELFQNDLAEHVTLPAVGHLPQNTSKTAAHGPAEVATKQWSAFFGELLFGAHGKGHAYNDDSAVRVDTS